MPTDCPHRKVPPHITQPSFRVGSSSRISSCGRLSRAPSEMALAAMLPLPWQRWYDAGNAVRVISDMPLAARVGQLWRQAEGHVRMVPTSRH
eukprot:357270-Chlamydomonas_euryale.AAC.11